MTNRYPAKCRNCKITVHPGDGLTVKDPTSGKWITVHNVCGQTQPRGSSVAGAMNAYRQQLSDEDDAAYDAEIADDIASADAYTEYVADLVRAAFARGVPGKTEQGAWYDYTPVEITVPTALGLDGGTIQTILNRGAGEKMAAYGRFGGYSTISGVTPGALPGTFVVLNCYHIGD